MDDRAVSPILGTILLVGMVMILFLTALALMPSWGRDECALGADPYARNRGASDCVQSERAKQHGVEWCAEHPAQCEGKDLDECSPVVARGLAVAWKCSPCTIELDALGERRCIEVSTTTGRA